MSIVRVYSRINNTLGLNCENFGLYYKEIVLIPNSYGSISMLEEKSKRLSLIPGIKKIIKR